MSDYKWDIQMLAEELAEEEFGKDFYELSPNHQHIIYTKATAKYVDRMRDQADNLRKAERERI